MLPRLKADNCAGDGQIEAANTALTILGGTAGHGNGQDHPALIPDGLWKTPVLAPEQQHVALLKTNVSQRLSSTATAADQSRWHGQSRLKLIEVSMHREINMRPVIKSRALEMAVIDGETERFN